MRKTLIALLLGLSSCVSQQVKCPDDEDLLRAGFRILSASGMIESEKEVDHRLARTMYRVASEYYFPCKNSNPEHGEKHYREAEDMASKYFGFDKERRRRFAGNVIRIKEEIASTLLKKK